MFKKKKQNPEAQDKKRSKVLTKFLKDHDSIGDAEDRRVEFYAATDALAADRFQICLAILLLLFPSFSILEAIARGTFPIVGISLHIRLAMEIIICVFLGLSYIDQFKRSVYVMTFLLLMIVGAYNVTLMVLEKSSPTDSLIFYAILFSILGVVMPWGAKPLARISLPIYLFYPLGILIGRIPITTSEYCKNNAYLFSLIVIVIVGAQVNERFRFQEFVLKKRFEGLNRVLEDYQKRLERSYDRVENMAIVDHLTGVYNRTYLTKWITSDIHRIKPPVEVFSLIMYDMDEFKSVNDQAGHKMGDRMLQRVTELVKENLIGSPPIFRYGGDEFCLILPGMDMPGAIQTAEQMRKAIERAPESKVQVSEGQISVTLSIGIISDFVSGAVDADFLIRWADAALLESKRQGRNCIHVFDSAERKILPSRDWLKINGFAT